MGALRLPANARLWAVVGMMFFLAAFNGAPLTLSGPPVAHVDHHVSATGHLDHLASVDHDHIESAATPSAPDAFADALLPRLRTALTALGLVFVVGLLWRWSPQHTILVGRDPPRTQLSVSPGRDVLSRLCISRR